MVTITTELSEEQASKLEELARKEGVTAEKLVRDAVERLLWETQGLSREERWEKALGAVGRFRADVTDLSTNHDRYFAEGCDPDDAG